MQRDLRGSIFSCSVFWKLKYTMLDAIEVFMLMKNIPNLFDSNLIVGRIGPFYLNFSSSSTIDS